MSDGPTHCIWRRVEGLAQPAWMAQCQKNLVESKEGPHGRNSGKCPHCKRPIHLGMSVQANGG